MNNENIGKYLNLISKKFWTFKIVCSDDVGKEQNHFNFHGLYKEINEDFLKSQELLEFGTSNNLEELLQKVCKKMKLL